MARGFGKFRPLSRLALALCGLLSLASAARAHVDPKDEQILYEVSVHLTAMRLDDDGDIDADLGLFSWLFGAEFFRRHGDIILNTSVQQIGHDPVSRTYSYAQIAALNYDDKRGRIALDLPIYYHEQCHPIKGDFRLRIDVFDDDDSVLLKWWNGLVGGVRWAAIRAAKEAIRTALTSGGSPAASALEAATGRGAAAILEPLLGELGQGGAAEKARDVATIALDKLLDDVPVIGGAYAWASEQLDKLDAALEDLLSTIYDYTLGLIFSERAPKEHLGGANITLWSPKPTATRNGAPIASLPLDVSPRGSSESSGRFDYEIREQVMKPAEAPECVEEEQQTTQAQQPRGSGGAPASAPTGGSPTSSSTPVTTPTAPASSSEPALEQAAPSETPQSQTSPVTAPPAGEGEAPPEESSEGEAPPPATSETTAEPEKKRGRRLRSALGGIARELVSPPPPAPSGPVLTRSPQLSRCADMLGANTGREHRAEGARRGSSGLSFVRADLRLYIDSKEPQITDEMKNCARLLLNFLDGNSTESDKNWVVRIYETAYERGYSGG
jgi:hypothetical protein